MAKNNALHAKRKQVLDRQRAANRKVARHEAKGVKLAGTKYDPRRPAANIARYTAAQLDAHLNRLNTFMSRRTQFVGDVHGRPFNPKAWGGITKIQAGINRVKRESLNEIKDVRVPGTKNITVADRIKIMQPDRPHAGNPAANPYYLAKVKGNKFTSERALQKVARDLEKKLKSDFMADDLATDRRVADEMADALNRPDIAEALAGLSDKQFNVLWNFSRFATAMSLPYKMYNETKPGGTGPKSWHQGILDDNLESAVELINDAKTLKFRR